MDQLAAGDNVVFLANHQSEADPQVMSVCLEQAGFPEAASGITYVAGHKVTTDALAIPFSMGRNLICIHSKKHIDTDPETKPLKQRQNLNAMSDMLGMLKQGGTALWVAPSGGRDRRDLTTGKVPIAKFDSKTIDMFRLMGNKSKKPTHYYPLAMVTYDLCPPPDYVEAGTGEQRNVRFTRVGISCGEELISDTIIIRSPSGSSELMETNPPLQSSNDSLGQTRYPCAVCRHFALILCWPMKMVLHFCTSFRIIRMSGPLTCHGRT